MSVLMLLASSGTALADGNWFWYCNQEGHTPANKRVLFYSNVFETPPNTNVQGVANRYQSFVIEKAGSTARVDIGHTYCFYERSGRGPIADKRAHAITTDKIGGSTDQVFLDTFAY
jgi:hypothetical protein